MISNRKTLREGSDVFRGLLLPVVRGSVCDWVEENVVLPTGAITGRVQMSYIPYAREILERYGDRNTRHIVMVFPTQAAKTTILTCGMLFKIAKDAEDAMWVMGNADQARDFNKERFMPFVHLCKPVLDLVPRTSGGVINKHLWGFTSQHYRSMVLNFVGAGSTTNLSSRPRGFLQLDECDKYYEELKFDSGTIQLAEERQKTFAFPLSVKASSPTTAHRMIWSEYKKTDQRKYFVPCPRCGKEILMQFKVVSEKHGECGLRWWHNDPNEAKTDGQWDMQKVRSLAHYRCQECGGMIHSFERQEMLLNGIWRPQNQFAEAGRFGYHINSLYSILGNETSLGSIAIKFLLAKGLKSELQNFVNGWLAEPWDESEAYENRQVKLEVFKAEEIPTEDALPIMGVDCQEGHFWAVVRLFAPPSKEKPFGESWLLFADRVDTEDELAEVQKDYKVKGENVLCDMAHRPNQVGKMILERDWRGIWGSPTTKQYYHPQEDGTRVSRPYSVVQFRDPMMGTAWQNRTFQRARYVLFSKDAVLDMVSSLRYAEPSIWHITANCSPRYARHLNSRIKVQHQNNRNGRIEWIWKELHQENHLADAENFVTVRALQHGMIILPGEVGTAITGGTLGL